MHVGPEPALLKVRPGLLYVLRERTASERGSRGWRSEGAREQGRERGKREREGRRDGEPERGGEGGREKQSTCRYERSSATFIFAGLAMGEAECASGTTTNGVGIQNGMCRSCSYEDSKSAGVGCRSRHLSLRTLPDSSSLRCTSALNPHY